MLIWKPLFRMSTGFCAGASVVAGMPLPGSDRRKTTKFPVPLTLPLVRGGRVILFHAVAAELGDAVVV